MPTLMDMWDAISGKGQGKYNNGDGMSLQYEPNPNDPVQQSYTGGPPESLADNLPSVPTSKVDAALQYGLPALGMIPSAKNLSKFMQLFDSALGKIAKNPEAPTSLEQAMAYINTRYPKLADLKNLKFEEKGPELLEAGTKGRISSRQLETPEGERYFDHRMQVGNTPEGRGIGDLVETFAHELQHGRDYVRTKGEIFNNYVDPKTDMPKYFLHPAEVRAHNAGSTALEGLDKLYNMLNPRSMIANWLFAPPVNPSYDAKKLKK